MPRWLIALVAFAVGGCAGFFVGATPLYLSINGHGGPLKGLVENLERRSQELTVPATSKARTQEVVATRQISLAAYAEIAAATGFCEMPDELKARVVLAAERIRSAEPTMRFHEKDAAAAQAYLTRVSPVGPCVRFIPPTAIIAAS
ncbi:hypothetical protein [Dyella amyloliquefaciens]|uniref:hypothetical protein n=1 Tax=Dyella amyloliquefaciens TaxID=1770545 RepID=UPI00102EAD84|nr:hypothetical protein [Dyella amyloliquefaciens]